MHTSRFQLPLGYHVRFDFHQHPRGVSAIVVNTMGAVSSVGFAKFNPNDEQFNVETGKSIALGRALAKMPRHLTTRNPALRSRLLRELAQQRTPLRSSPRLRTGAELEDLGRSIADELVMVPTD